MTKKILLLSFLFCFVSVNGYSQKSEYIRAAMTGNDLIALARAYVLAEQNGTPNTKSKGFADITAGLLDGMFFGGNKLECVPAQVSYGQLYSIFADYLIAHPEQLHWPASILLHGAIIEKFPPPKKQ